MGLNGHCEDFGFLSERNGGSMEGFKQRMSLIFSKDPFVYKMDYMGQGWKWDQIGGSMGKRREVRSGWPSCHR